MLHASIGLKVKHFVRPMREAVRRSSFKQRRNLFKQRSREEVNSAMAEPRAGDFGGTVEDEEAGEKKRDFQEERRGR